MIQPTPKEDDMKVLRATLGVDGNCGFALLGKNLQEGEAEFEEIRTDAPLGSTGAYRAEKIAINRAYQRLKARLGLEHLSYYIGPSHPDHC